MSIIIPAKNEAENLRLLLPDLKNALESLGVQGEILVVDPDSPDATREVVDAEGARYIQEKSAGYGGALMEGFKQAQGACFITMDADHSHPAAFIKELWAARDQGDILIASRYVAGGKADQPRFRLLLSIILNKIFRMVLGTNIRDLSSGYRLYRRASVQDLNPKLSSFAVLVELLLLAQDKGCRIAEIPFHYQPREHGQSQARILAFGWDYLMLLLKLRGLGKGKRE